MNTLRLTEEQLAAHQAKRAREYARLDNASAAEIDTRKDSTDPLSASPSPRAEAPFALICIADGLPRPVAEFRFHPTRRWRFDFAWPDKLLAVEFDGAVWTQGRHTRGAGYLEDMHKLNAAVLLGWSVLRFAPNEISEAVAAVRLMLA